MYQKAETSLCQQNLYSQKCGFSNSPVWMWELGHKESWVQKNWCFWTVVLGKTLESPLDSKEIQPVHLKSILNIQWKNNIEAETTILWPHDWKRWLTHWKRPWCWESLKAGEGDDRGWDGWMASPPRWTWVWVNSQEIVEERGAWRAAVHGVTKSWTWLNCWTTTKIIKNQHKLGDLT